MNKLILIILSLWCSAVLAASQIETVQVNHRLAQEILPEVTAVLPANATARAFNNMIIIKAEPETITAVKKLINTLDTPPQRLKITVLKTATKLASEQQSQWQGHIDIDEKNSSANVAVETWSTDSDNKDNAQYQAQGLAGLPIRLNMGQLIPQTQQDVVIRFNGDVFIQTNTNYIPINNGFEAIARVLPNNQVSIEIYPQFSSYSQRHGTIDHTDLITTISGPASTWLELAQIDTNENRNVDGSKHYQTHKQTQQYLYIKLEHLLSNN